MDGPESERVDPARRSTTTHRFGLEFPGCIELGHKLVRDRLLHLISAARLAERRRHREGQASTYGVVVGGLSRRDHVHLGRAGGDDLDRLAILRLQVDGGTLALVHRDTWDSAIRLQLRAGAVDNFGRGNHTGHTRPVSDNEREGGRESGESGESERERSVQSCLSKITATFLHLSR